METKTTTRVKSQKAKLNINNVNISNRQEKNIAKNIKKASKSVNVGIALLIILISLIIGVGAYFIVCKDDCFELIGPQEISIETEEVSGGFKGEFEDTYLVKIIEFGKDYSNEVIIETDMNALGNNKYSVNDLGTYYISYSVNTIKYGKLFSIKKIRLISFVEPISEVLTD